MTATSPIQIGSPAPGFTLTTQDGDQRSLAEFAGRKNVLLVFYPFAFSGICTGELTEIRDHLENFESEEVQVLCISCDPVFALRGWADKGGYFFPLLSDFWPHGAVARAYDVFNEQRGMPSRGTFLIDREGIVRWTLLNGPGQVRDFTDYHRALAELTGSSQPGANA